MWPFFLALKQLFPPRRMPVFAFVSILGVAFGVTALLVVQTVMNSFGEEHRRRIREAVGDVTIESYRKTIGNAANIEAALAKTPGVAAVSPFIDGSAVYQTEGPTRDTRALPFFGVRGIDPKKAAKIFPFNRYDADGKIADLDDDRIVLGAMLASRMDIIPGDRFTLQSGTKARKLLDEAMNNEMREAQLPKEVELWGTIRTGYQPFDEGFALVTLRAARELFELPANTVTGFHLKLSNPEDAEEVAFALNAKLPDDLRATPWTRFRKEFLDAIEMEKAMLFLLMFIITLVASFSIGSTLFSHVVRRTREIGLLSALGSSPAQILKIFLAQGFLIGLLGYAIGVALTFLIMTFRQQIIMLMGAQETLLKQYMFGEVPLHYNAGDFGKAAALTIVLMTLASLLPAIWAARRKPSEAMRDVV